MGLGISARITKATLNLGVAYRLIRYPFGMGAPASTSIGGIHSPKLINLVSRIKISRRALTLKDRYWTLLGEGLKLKIAERLIDQQEILETLGSVPITISRFEISHGHQGSSTKLEISACYIGEGNEATRLDINFTIPKSPWDLDELDFY